MEHAKRLVINVVTWNSERFLSNLFASLDAQSSQDMTVSVVDNASTDGTQSWIQTHHPEVSVLRNFRNQGFARAHNQGIAIALSRWQQDGADLSQRYVCVLNPDIVLDRACVEEIIRYMDAHPDVAIAGPKLYRALRRTDDETDPYALERTDVIDSAGLSVKRSRSVIDRGAGEKDAGQYDRMAPFGISGAAMVIRASAVSTLCLSEHEVFDESFFAYKEDADLCWRARLLGLRIELIATATGWHYRFARNPGGSGLFGRWRLLRETWRRPDMVVRLSRRNQLWMVWKNDDFANRWRHAPWILWQGTLAILASFVVFQYLRGMVEAWMGMAQIRAKRRILTARRKVSPEEMRKWFI